MQFKNRFKAYLKYSSLLNSWWTQSISERYKSFSKLFSNCFHKVANFESQNMSKSIVVQNMSKCWYKLSAFWLTLTGTIWRNTTWCFAVLDRHTSVFCSSVLSTFFLKQSCSEVWWCSAQPERNHSLSYIYQHCGSISGSWNTAFLSSPI